MKSFSIRADVYWEVPVEVRDAVAWEALKQGISVSDYLRLAVLHSLAIQVPFDRLLVREAPAERAEEGALLEIVDSAAAGAEIR